MNRKFVLLVGALFTLSGCDGFREAMTAHVGTVARAGSQELTVDEFADLLGNSPIPLSKDLARSVADLWINYQLLGTAAARGDSLNAPAVLDSAMWMATMNFRSQKYLEQVSASWVPEDESYASEESYNQGNLLAARHILFRVPDNATPAQRDSIRARAEATRATITPASFGRLAQEFGEDGTSQQGGFLGVFPRGQMVPEFERAVLALAPGEIGPVLQTQFGYHIVMRSPYADVRDEFAQVALQHASFRAESTFFAALEESGNVEIRPNIARKVKAVAADADGHLSDRSVLATSAAGNFTAGRLARYVTAAPPQTRMRETILAADDSIAPEIVKYFLRSELVARSADSANVVLDSAEFGEMRRAYMSALTSAWGGLGVSPHQLADSVGEAVSDRESLAAARIDRYMEGLLTDQVQFVEIPSPLVFALRDSYDFRVQEAGLDRALEAAERVRQTAEAARAAQQPPSAVPMPGQDQQGTNPGSEPQQ